MKITDLRCQRLMEGDYVVTIPGGASPTDEQLEEFLGLTPGNKSYAQHKRTTTHKRIVLAREGGGYYVVAVNPKFYKVVS